MQFQLEHMFHSIFSTKNVAQEHLPPTILFNWNSNQDFHMHIKLKKKLKKNQHKFFKKN